MVTHYCSPSSQDGCELHCNSVILGSGGGALWCWGRYRGGRGFYFMVRNHVYDFWEERMNRKYLHGTHEQREENLGQKVRQEWVEFQKMLSKNEVYRVQWVVLLGYVERLSLKSDDESPEGTDSGVQWRWRVIEKRVSHGLAHLTVSNLPSDRQWYNYIFIAVT